jgi:hypothetical protein
LFVSSASKGGETWHWGKIFGWTWNQYVSDSWRSSCSL